jgi:hypothetical protein
MSGTPAGPPIGTVTVAVLVMFVWVVQLATLSDLSASDPAGNGMAQGFAAIEMIVLWLLLAVLVLIAAVKGSLPIAVVIAAVVAILLSGLAAMSALGLLSDPNTAPFLWPIVVSAVVPPLVVLFCLWAVIPVVRAAIPVAVAAGIVWGITLAVSASVWPMESIRTKVLAERQAARDRWDVAFATLPRDAPLWEWVALLPTADVLQESAVIEGIKHLDRRQNDAETMLERGDFPLRYLGRIDLNPTQKICDTARALLRRKIEPLVLPPGVTRPYPVIRANVEAAVAAMDWLVGYDCSCDTESLAWETMANAYSDTEFDVYRLRELRDPKELGRMLRDSPEHFSMLSPKSHLRAWLHFATDDKLHDRALVGARALEHRTDDAVEMLNGSDFDRWDLLVYLPDLDLRSTPELCAAALAQVQRELAQIYLPASDDPRPYRELIERMGTGEPLRALIWLADHGCDAHAMIEQAEALVRAYQDSPPRTAMLTKLDSLNGKR